MNKPYGANLLYTYLAKSNQNELVRNPLVAHVCSLSLLEKQAEVPEGPVILGVARATDTVALDKVVEATEGLVSLSSRSKINNTFADPKQIE